ncbi:hypothetical protein [Marinibactrum halimedae]|uniref:Uncharacterized protein n=1 Tax=Marinibactrum halimedae TaxID=1444977 RepID=A0AA37WN03_9GAMM|nr:hypothetical protein [Marinibactrum halimedae]MCD9460373.1 hypothetical protein [Marinibactrum halimedae]GLS26810.1 hypothetical protein GCM10007877_25290 [Marinibactrum halimedae]
MIKTLGYLLTLLGFASYQTATACEYHALGGFGLQNHFASQQTLTQSVRIDAPSMLSVSSGEAVSVSAALSSLSRGDTMKLSLKPSSKAVKIEGDNEFTIKDSNHNAELNFTVSKSGAHYIVLTLTSENTGDKKTQFIYISATDKG